VSKRLEFSRKTKQAALKRADHRCEAVGQTFICASCSTPFDRAYSIAAKRSANPQFCSRSCYVAERAKRAAVNLGKRFWRRVDIKSSTECWEWQGRRNDSGYGEFDNGNRPHIASRVAYELTNGPIDPVLKVCHSCDNPPCVNPAHLWLGTNQENMLDAQQKGRLRGGNGLRGSAINRSRLCIEQVREIRVSGKSAKELAEQYGVSTTAIRKIWNRENWGWLDA
jgi:hypothetical protein